jgi:ribonuclease-3
MKILMKSIGYSFNNISLLKTALTHRSKDIENNERLEFLGDAVLGVIITARLFKQFPYAKEGELSRLRANLVNESSLAEIAQKFKLGDHLRLGQGELKSGGVNRKSILADTLEAIIGAIYLDADIITCEKIILAWFGERLNNLGKIEAQKDPKSRLQEYLQSHQISLPIYTVISATGESHAQQFEVSCKVENLDYQSLGSGSSRRAAEQMAAEDFLTWLLKQRK